MKTLFFFDLDTGQLLDRQIIDCPESHELAVPFDATLIPPPQCSTDQAPQFDRTKEKWTIVDDFTNVPYYRKDTKQRVRVPFGERPSSFVTNIPPPKMMQQATRWDETSNSWVYDLDEARKLKTSQIQIQAYELYDRCLCDIGFDTANFTNHHYMLMSAGKVQETAQFATSVYYLTQIINEVNRVTDQMQKTDNIREIANLTFDLTYRQLINNKQ